MSRGELVIAGFEPNRKQLAAARAAVGPARVVMLDGSIRAGKTQAAARILLEWAVEQPATYLVARGTYRSLRDSTMKAMIYGDGALPPLIPPELVEQYRASDELVRLKSGAEILFRSLEPGNLSKILNLSLAGVLVDQVEEIDPGADGERVFDTLLGRLSDPRGPRKLLAVANPAGLTSWQYRRLVDEQTRDPFVARVHFTLRDNAENLPADYVAAMEATRLSRPAWYRSFILGEWGAFEGQAFEEFDPAVHVVPAFDIPTHWPRFESMDHGLANPTAWLAWAADEDGNLIVFGEHYRAGWTVSQHAAEVLRLRREAWRQGEHVPVWADPATKARIGWRALKWTPDSVATEYAEHGVRLLGGNNDRAAGYARLLELLHIEPDRLPPPWANVPADVDGAPRLYIVDTCENLIAQLRSAPIEPEGLLAGQAINGQWEGAHGHAVAAARYGALSWQRPSEPAPPPEPADERAHHLQALRDHNARIDAGEPDLSQRMYV